MKKEINPVELDFLLRYPSTPNSATPVDFISNVSWGAIKTLSGMDEFRFGKSIILKFQISKINLECCFIRNLDRDIENNSKRWRKFVEAEAPEKEKFPQVKFKTV